MIKIENPHTVFREVIIIWVVLSTLACTNNESVDRNVHKNYISDPDAYERIWKDDFEVLDESTWTIGLKDSSTGDMVPAQGGQFLLNSNYAGYITSEDSRVSDGNLVLSNQKRTVSGVDPVGISKPNIIVILVDDAGYADFGFMGSKDLLTPHIDQLANAGMVFTDAHVSASVCAPSRAGLLTGRYQQRFGFECNALAHFEGIDPNQMTIAEALRPTGYKTAVFGKWHVGDLPQARPNNRGFDYSWAFLSGARDYFPNENQDVEGHLKSIRENDRFTTFDGYLTDVLANKAMEFIEANKTSPFFIYWSPNAVHTPMQATEVDLKKFEGHPRQHLAAMTWALDRAVGKLVSKLQTENLLT